MNVIIFTTYTLDAYSALFNHNSSVEKQIAAIYNSHNTINNNRNNNLNQHYQQNTRKVAVIK